MKMFRDAPPEWATDNTKALHRQWKAAADDARERRKRFNADVQALRSDDLATVAIPNPVNRMQAELAILRDEITCRQTETDVLDALRDDLKPASKASANESAAVRAELASKLAELGYREFEDWDGRRGLDLIYRNARIREQEGSEGKWAGIKATLREEWAVCQAELATLQTRVNEIEGAIRKLLEPVTVPRGDRFALSADV